MISIKRFCSRIPRTMMKYKQFFKEKLVSDAMREFIKSNEEENINHLIHSQECLTDIMDLMVAAEAFQKKNKCYNDFRSDLIKFIKDLEVMTRPVK